MNLDISLVLATWGAFLSTYLAIRGIIKDQPSLKFVHKFTRDGDFPYLVISATNVGNKPIIIKDAHYLIGTTKAKRSFISETIKIDSYDCYDFNIRLDDKIDEFGDFDLDFFNNVFEFSFITSTGKSIQHNLLYSIDRELWFHNNKQNLNEISASLTRLKYVSKKIGDKNR